MALHGSLQSLNFCNLFTQKYENAASPDSLRFLRFANRFRPSLENVTLRGSLWSLELLGLFTQSLENVAFPDYLQFLRFDSVRNQGLKIVALLDHLWNLENVWPRVAACSVLEPL